jgi:hypothetical protein
MPASKDPKISRDDHSSMAELSPGAPARNARNAIAPNVRNAQAPNAPTLQRVTRRLNIGPVYFNWSDCTLQRLSSMEATERSEQTYGHPALKPEFNATSG